MVDHKEELNERLVAIKGYIRKAQLQTNLVENPEIGKEVDVTGISDEIDAALHLALLTAKDVPPIDRMIVEALRVWEGSIPFRKIKDLEYMAGWLVGVTFAIISVIDYYLEAGQ